jgi:hypothetical protein
MIDQIAERARADIVGTDQPQPIEPLLVAQFDAVAHAAPKALYGRQHRKARGAVQPELNKYNRSGD